MNDANSNNAETRELNTVPYKVWILDFPAEESRRNLDLKHPTGTLLNFHVILWKHVAETSFLYVRHVRRGCSVY